MMRAGSLAMNVKKSTFRLESTKRRSYIMAWLDFAREQMLMGRVAYVFDEVTVCLQRSLNISHASRVCRKVLTKLAAACNHILETQSRHQKCYSYSLVLTPSCLICE